MGNNCSITQPINRDPSIDFIRAIGILLIISAHVYIPTWLGQFRCFDVPLLIFVSGLVHAHKDIKASTSFYLYRTLRLILPVWLFYCVIYIPGFYIAQCIGLVPEGFINIDIFISLLLLLNSSGYIWIIRVFLIIMLATPMLVKINKMMISFKAFVLLLTGIFVIDTLFVECLNIINTRVTAETPKFYKAAILFLNEYVAYLLGYSILFLLGVRLRDVVKNKISVTIICIVTLVVFGIILYLKDGSLVLYPRYKYPPHLFFIIYGVCMCILIWNNIDILRPIINNRLLQFIGNNTMWIYLWHIIFVYIFNEIIGSWVLRYFLTVVCTLIVYYLQYRIVSLAGSRILKKYLLG